MPEPQTEFAFLDWLQKETRTSGAISSFLATPIGDDCAGLNLSGRGEVLVTTDIRLDGTHFDTRAHSWQAIGHKALACSLSDIAAMAAVPVGAVIAVALPRPTAHIPHPFELAQQLWKGMTPLAERYHCPIIGGDTTTWTGPLAICATCLGVSDGLGPIHRSTARPGDLIFVTGWLGGSILGRHLNFLPRVNEARQLAQAVPLSSLMDVSDGIASDLRHICTLSGVRAELDEAALLTTASPNAHELAKEDHRPLLEHVLCDGEDFELLFTAGADQLPALQQIRLGCPITPIGRILSADAGLPRITRISPGGERQSLELMGYEHR